MNNTIKFIRHKTKYIKTTFKYYYYHLKLMKNMRKITGRPSKLTRKNLDDLKKYFEKKRVCTVKELHEYIRDTFNVSYSEKEIRVILKKFNFNYYIILKKYTDENYYKEKIVNKLEYNKRVKFKSISQ